MVVGTPSRYMVGYTWQQAIHEHNKQFALSACVVGSAALACMVSLHPYSSDIPTV
jgi:hypothetical protein